METLKRMLNLSVWDANNSLVWREIVSRFGQADYDDASKRAGHETTLEAEWTAYDYARKREAEYPSIAELTVALYDTDDKAAIETKRAAVKAKYPKPS